MTTHRGSPIKTWPKQEFGPFLFDAARPRRGLFWWFVDQPLDWLYAAATIGCILTLLNLLGR